MRRDLVAELPEKVWAVIEIRTEDGSGFVDFFRTSTILDLTDTEPEAREIARSHTPEVSGLCLDVEVEVVHLEREVAVEMLLDTARSMAGTVG